MILDSRPTKSNIQDPLIKYLLPALQRVLRMGDGTKTLGTQICPAEIAGSS